jgi:hypothetical protein
MKQLEQAARTNKVGIWATTHESIGKITIFRITSGQMAVITDQGELWTWGQLYEKPTKIMDDVLDVRLSYYNRLPQQVSQLNGIQKIEANGLSFFAVDDEGEPTFRI